MMRLPYRRLAILVVSAGVTASCATTPPVAPPVVPLTFEQKMAWILRLEEDRVLRGIEPPAPPPVAPQGRPGATAAAVVPPQPNLLTLVTDTEARVRRRAALAIGRTRLAEGIPALVPVLSGDADAEVRQMAAFALGLIGDASAAAPLETALSDLEAIVQGRAAEALGLIGHRAGAGPIADMMAGHTKAGVLDGIAADDLEYPKAPAVEAVRLGMYALVRLNAYDQLAAVLLNPNGQPISRWWPVAYAFRRINDPRAGAALLALLQGDGVYTRAFAARGLGIVKEARAAAPLIATGAGGGGALGRRTGRERGGSASDQDRRVCRGRSEPQARGVERARAASRRRCGGRVHRSADRCLAVAASRGAGRAGAHGSRPVHVRDLRP
jgi:hypothetical protein